MFKFHTLRTVAIALIALMSAPGAHAFAQETVTVRVNMARILRMNAPASTVVVGNPGVADVAIQDPQTLVLTGKTYGQTNLIVLNANGDPIADTTIEVTKEDAGTVTVYMSSARTTFSCSPKCLPAVMVGDDFAYTQAQVESLGLVKQTIE